MMSSNSSDTVSAGMHEIFDVAAARGHGLTVLEKTGQGSRTSYASICERSREIAGGLQAEGIGTGNVVGIVVGHPANFFAECIGVWRAGGAVMPIVAPTRIGASSGWSRDVHNQLQAVDARLLLVDHPVPHEFGIPARSAESLPSDRMKDVQPQTSDTALLHLTSGTTGVPKAVVLNYGTLVRRMKAHDKEYPYDPDVDHMLTWSPLHLSFGMANSLLRPLGTGVPSTYLPTEIFMTDPSRWLLEISRARATHSGGPHFAYRLAARALEKGYTDPVDLSCWKFATDSSEPIDIDTLEVFLRLAAEKGFDPTALCPTYGMTEANRISSSQPGDPVRIDALDREQLSLGRAIPTDEVGAARFVSLGQPVPDVTLNVVDANDEVLPERRIGNIYVKTPAMFDGYLDANATRQALRDGWFDTGDVGYVAQGEVFITGRQKDIIIIRGRNLQATEIEQIVNATLGVIPGSAIAFGSISRKHEELMVVAETQEATDRAACEKEIGHRLWMTVGVAAREIILLDADSLPRTAGGKLNRQEVKVRFRGGEGAS